MCLAPNFSLQYNITIELNVKVMRIKEMITNLRTFWLSNKFSLSLPQECRENSMENTNTNVTVISTHLPAQQITCIGQFSQLWENNFNRLPALADNLHPKTKENCQLTQSSFIVFVDMISFSVQLINFHTFCLCYFIENDTNCKNLF